MVAAGRPTPGLLAGTSGFGFAWDGRQIAEDVNRVVALRPLRSFYGSSADFHGTVTETTFRLGSSSVGGADHGNQAIARY